MSADPNRARDVSLTAAELPPAGRPASLAETCVPDAELRDRRYVTSESLARDVHRCLADGPVEARPPSAGYRPSKLFRRDRSAAFAVLLMAVALLVGSDVAAGQEVGATQQNEPTAPGLAAAEKRAVEAEKRAVEAERATAAALERERLTAYIYRLAIAHREWLANEVGRAERILDECPPDLRAWEWRYLRHLCHSEQVLFRDHADRVTAVAFSRDGTRIASASKAEVWIWDSTTGAEVLRITLPPRAVGVRYYFYPLWTPDASVSFSPDGKRLASAVSEHVLIFDATNGRELARIPVSDVLVTGVSFAPDGLRLAASCIANGGTPRGGEVLVWDARTGEVRHRFAELPTMATSVAYSPDGKHLAASVLGEGGEIASPGQVRIWDAESGEPVHTLETYKGQSAYGTDRHQVTHVAFSPDGKRLASAGWDGAVRVWEVADGREVHDLRGHHAPVLAVAFSPDGERLGSIGGDRVVRVWDAKTGRETNALRGHTRPVTSVAFSPDGRRIASAGGGAGESGEVRVWDAVEDQQAITFPGEAAMFSRPDGQWLKYRDGKAIKLLEMDTGRTRRFDMKSSEKLIKYSPDGATLAPRDGGKSNTEVRFWEHAEGTEVLRLHGSSIAFSPDGARMATGLWKNRLMISATRPRHLVDGVLTAEPLHVIQTQPPEEEIGWVWIVAFNPDGRRVATATYPGGREYQAEVKVWDAETGTLLMRLNGARGSGVHGVTFSPDGRQIAVRDGAASITVWDATSGAVLHSLSGPRGVNFSDMTYSPDSRRLVTASREGPPDGISQPKHPVVRLWDARTGREVMSLRGHRRSWGMTVAFSPDGRHTASATYGQVKLWDAGPD